MGKNILFVRANPTVYQNTRLPKSLAREVGYVPPLGIASIAAFLQRHGHQVAIIDAEAEELDLQQVRQRIIACAPDIVGVTSMTPTVHNDLAIARVAKEYGAYTVIGGPQINAMPTETLHYSWVDFGIQGEGEFPMLKLVEALDNHSSFDAVPGLVYRTEEGKIATNLPYTHPDIDVLPAPARELLPNDRYRAIIANGRLTTVCPGRGCPFRCGFCFKQPSDKHIRFRTPERIVDEIIDVVNVYQVKELDMVTDTLTVRREFVTEFCEILLKKNVRVSWIAPTRADCVDPELLRLMKRAGCRSLRFGVESGSPTILSLMRKNTDLDQIIHAFRWAKDAGIETFAYLIIGYIHETEQTLQETFALVDRLKPDLLMYNEALPLPGTLLFEQAAAAGLVEPDYWTKFLMDEEYPRIPYLFPDTDKWIAKAYRKFFLSPRFLGKKLLELRFGNLGNYVRAMKGILGLSG